MDISGTVWILRKGAEESEVYHFTETGVTNAADTLRKYVDALDAPDVKSFNIRVGGYPKKK